MTLTIKNDILTQFVFSVIGKAKPQSPIQAFLNPLMPSSYQRKKFGRAIQKESISGLVSVLNEINSNIERQNSGDSASSFDLRTTEHNLLLHERMSFYNVLESDSTHYYISPGYFYAKGVLSGFKCLFTEGERHVPIYLFAAYIDSILGEVTDSSECIGYEHSEFIITDNPLNYIVVLAEYYHFFYGGTLVDEIDRTFIARWIPNISDDGELLSTRNQVIKNLYAKHGHQFQLEKKSISTESDYQQRKRNLGPKKLNSRNVRGVPEKVSISVLERHLGLNRHKEFDYRQIGMLHIQVGLVNYIDLVQRRCIQDGASAQEIVAYFSELPSMQQQFRDRLLEYSRNVIDI